MQFIKEKKLAYRKMLKVRRLHYLSAVKCFILLHSYTYIILSNTNTETEFYEDY